MLHEVLGEFERCFKVPIQMVFHESPYREGFGKPLGASRGFTKHLYKGVFAHAYTHFSHFSYRHGGTSQSPHKAHIQGVVKPLCDLRDFAKVPCRRFYKDHKGLIGGAFMGLCEHTYAHCGLFQTYTEGIPQSPL